MMDDVIDTLEAARADAFRHLARGAAQRKSPMHTPVIGTADGDLRVMVLREFDPEAAALRFHTDIRSPKVAAIADNAAVSILAYDGPSKVQIRARGMGRVEVDTPAADKAWAAGDNFAKRCYLGAGPGAVSDTPTSGLPPEMEGVQPVDEQVIPARPNFAVLLIDLHHIDWLFLAHTGHMRAQFDRTGDSWQGRWVTP